MASEVEGHSLWTLLLQHVTLSDPKYGRYPNEEAKDRLWFFLKSDVLSFFLKQGADPNACLNKRSPGYTAFQAYLRLSLSIKPDLTHEDLYLRGLDAFYAAGVDLVSSVPVDDDSRNFFCKLQDPRAIQSSTGFLMEVTDGLLHYAYMSKVEWPMHLIWLTLGRVLPSNWIRKAKDKYPGVGTNTRYKRRPQMPGYEEGKVASTIDLTGGS